MVLPKATERLVDASIARRELDKEETRRRVRRYVRGGERRPESGAAAAEDLLKEADVEGGRERDAPGWRKPRRTAVSAGLRVVGAGWGEPRDDDERGERGDTLGRGGVRRSCRGGVGGTTLGLRELSRRISSASPLAMATAIFPRSFLQSLPYKTSLSPAMPRTVSLRNEKVLAE